MTSTSLSRNSVSDSNFYADSFVFYDPRPIGKIKGTSTYHDIMLQLLDPFANSPETKEMATIFYEMFDRLTQNFPFFFEYQASIEVQNWCNKLEKSSDTALLSHFDGKMESEYRENFHKIFQQFSIDSDFEYFGQYLQTLFNREIEEIYSTTIYKKIGENRLNKSNFKSSAHYRSALCQEIIDRIDKGFHFKPSSWQPQHSFITLFNELYEKGPIIIEGVFYGIRNNEKEIKTKKSKGNQIHIKKNHLSLYEKTDLIVLIGAKSVKRSSRNGRFKNVVYYVTPKIDHEENWKIFRMPYELLTLQAETKSRVVDKKNEKNNIYGLYKEKAVTKKMSV